MKGKGGCLWVIYEGSQEKEKETKLNQQKWEKLEVILDITKIEQWNQIKIECET